MATETPKPSPGANPRRWNVTPRPLGAASTTTALSPSFSRAPFRNRLGAADGHSSSPHEQPCVTLFEWWLVRVEGDDQKIAVAGFTERNQTVQIFTSAPIVKRYEASTIESEDGIIVLIYGSLNISRTRENGFSIEVCEKFLIGFPHWWESCNALYPMEDSHIGSQSSSSNTLLGSTQFYLEKFQLGKFLDSVGPSFIRNLVNSAKSFSGNATDADTFQKCSFLSNVTPRFEEVEFTRDSYISRKEKASASKDSSKGSAAVCKEVDNMEIDLVVGSTLKEIGHTDIDLNGSLPPTEECSSDETYKDAENQNDIMHPDPDAGKQEVGSHLVNSNLIYNKSTDHIPSDLEDGNTIAESSVDLGSKVFLTTLPSERANCSSEIAGDLENSPPISHERTPVASLKNQVCQKRTKHTALNVKVVTNEDASTSVRSDVQSLKKPVGPGEEQKSVHEVLQGVTRSPMMRSSIRYAHQSPFTRAKAKVLSVSTPESLKLRRTRSGRVSVPSLDPGCQRIVYDRNGLIFGVTGLELQSPPKGSKSEAPVKKKRAH